MSRQLSEPSKTELEVVIDRRMIGVGAAIALLLVVVPVVGFLCFGRQKSESPPEPVVTQLLRPASASRADEPRVRFDPAAVASLEPPRPTHVEAPGPAPTTRKSAQSRPQPKPVVVDKRPQPTELVAAAPSATEAPVSNVSKFKRLDSVYDFQLLGQLREMPELALDQASKKSLLSRPETAGRKDAKEATAKSTEPKHALLELASKKTELKGLPLIQAKDCRKQEDAALVMVALSMYFRSLAPKSPANRSQSAGLVDEIGDSSELVSVLQSKNLSEQVKDTAKLVKELRNRLKWDGKLRGEALAVLVQMLQVKGSPVRLELVKMLDNCEDTSAGVLLAKRAIFDLDAEVRQAAVAALKKRPRAQYRQVFLEGLRHPWPPVAAHAAEAIAELHDLDAAPPLAALLDQPDPGAPVMEGPNRWVVREMVGINHLQNCVLCHAPSHADTDPGRSPVPTPGQPLTGGYSSRSKGGVVRTDITYLRQDFSVMQLVEKPDKWPRLQRFDYVVRTRELSAEEATRRLNPGAGTDPCDYPQRSAVLFALREITGEDAGTSSADWKRLLSRIGLEAIPASGPVGDSASTISKKSFK